VQARRGRRRGRGRGRTNKRKRNAARSNIMKSFLQRQTDCIVACDPNHMPENEMCISQCMSPTCHDSNFRLHEKKMLEPGEFDPIRAIAFEECVKEEIGHSATMVGTDR
jgi:hypothetical protein